MRAAGSRRCHWDAGRCCAIRMKMEGSESGPDSPAPGEPRRKTGQKASGLLGNSGSIDGSTCFSNIKRRPLFYNRAPESSDSEANNMQEISCRDITSHHDVKGKYILCYNRSVCFLQHAAAEVERCHDTCIHVVVAVFREPAEQMQIGDRADKIDIALIAGP